MQSRLEVVDNSGAKEVCVIKVLGGSKRKIATVGDVVVVSVKRAIPQSKVKAGDVCYAVIVAMRSPNQRKDGTFIRFDYNAAVLVNKKGQKYDDLIGTRVLKAIDRKLLMMQSAYPDLLKKICSMAVEVL